MNTYCVCSLMLWPRFSEDCCSEPLRYGALQGLMKSMLETALHTCILIDCIAHGRLV